MKIMLFAPELFLGLGALALLFLSTGKAVGQKARSLAVFVAVAEVVLCALCLNQNGELFYGAYKVDLFSQLVKLATSAGLAAILLFATQLKDVEEEIRAEYYVFLLVGTLGLLLLASSVELLTIFISLELSSFSLYLLVPMRSDRTGTRIQMESAIKYILFGVVATGVMLFGMSYMYGLTGSTYLAKLVPALSAMQGSVAAMAAIAMVLGGFFFKLAVFPFHFWSPDVYQGASNETTAFLSSVPKVAAVALLIRIASMINPGDRHVVDMIVIFSVCSMFYGNIIALVQSDIKRMLGFSGIAHAGYVLIGLVTLQQTGFALSLYYIVGYLFMNIAAFVAICKVSQAGENLSVSDLNGLHKRSPLLALTLAVSMFGMAGLPPFVGFMGKFMLLASAYKGGFLALVILAAINTAISIYYYLSVVKAVYTGESGNAPAVSVDAMSKLVSVALIALVVVLGIAPDAVIRVASDAVKAIL